jgi:hypothetical protein
MHATHLNCPACASVRPIRFEPLLRGEPSLGTSVYCAHCCRHALTLLRPARFYCDICDDVQPGLLERMEAGSPDDLGVVLVCAGCFDAKALLYATANPTRLAGAAASDPPPRERSADRARRG